MSNLVFDPCNSIDVQMPNIKIITSTDTIKLLNKLKDARNKNPCKEIDVDVESHIIPREAINYFINLNLIEKEKHMKARDLIIKNTHLRVDHNKNVYLNNNDYLLNKDDSIFIYDDSTQENNYNNIIILIEDVYLDIKNVQFNVELNKKSSYISFSIDGKESKNKHIVPLNVDYIKISKLVYMCISIGEFMQEVRRAEKRFSGSAFLSKEITPIELLFRVTGENKCQ